MTAVAPAAHARTILAAQERRRTIAPLSGRDPGLDLPAAYRVAAEVRRLRAARGERPVGRKIGFTNTTIWEEYGVRAPIWGTVYDTTLHAAAELDGPFPLDALVEPRIEPEIVFGLAAAPESGMDARALLACVAWVALGFELVQSLFPGWRFTAADTVAAFGLHGALVVGERVAIEPGKAGTWADALSAFTVTLSCDGKEIDRGSAGNVLGGGPLAALAHLVAALANDPEAPPLAAGETVTTGTLTRVPSVAPGQTWRADLSGLSLPGLTLALC